MSVTNNDTLPTLAFPTQDAWEAWLEAHHAQSDGLWLRIAKAGAGIPSVTYAQALESALCFGWIDGQKGALDEREWRQKFTPRRPRSVWSKVNVGHVERLIAAGRMHPAGLRQVELARADGRWDNAYDRQRVAAVPPDLQAALDANEAAARAFAALNRVNRYAILYRLHTAKRPATRAARLEQFIAMLARGETLHP